MNGNPSCRSRALDVPKPPGYNCASSNAREKRYLIRAHVTGIPAPGTNVGWLNESDSRDGGTKATWTKTIGDPESIAIRTDSHLDPGISAPDTDG